MRELISRRSKYLYQNAAQSMYKVHTISLLSLGSIEILFVGHTEKKTIENCTIIYPRRNVVSLLYTQFYHQNDHEMRFRPNFATN